MPGEDAGLPVERNTRRQVFGSESEGTNAARNRQRLSIHVSHPPDGKVRIAERRAPIAAAARRVDLQRDIKLYLLGGVVGSHSDGIVECCCWDSREETAQGIEREASRQGGQSCESDRAIGVDGYEPRGVFGVGSPLRKRLGEESECSVVSGAGSHCKGESDDDS